MTTLMGFIKTYDKARGFGFVTADDGQDFFFHVRSCELEEPDIRKYRRVAFETGSDPRTGRTRAFHVRPIEGN